MKLSRQKRHRYLLATIVIGFHNSLTDVLESGLPWHLILYGEEEEGIMAASPDPTIQAIWQDKQAKLKKRHVP